MRSRVRFPVLPWEFFLAGKDSRGDHGLGRFRFKAPPGISSSCISPLTSSGQRSRVSLAFQPQKSATLSPQPGGKPRKFIRTCGALGGGGVFKNEELDNFSNINRLDKLIVAQLSEKFSLKAKP